MNITPLNTHKITQKDTDIVVLLDKYVHSFPNKSILVVASKILAITQGRVLILTEAEKNELIKQESDYYLLPEETAYNLFLTLKDNHLTYSAGIDESNADGKAVLWPHHVQQEANRIRKYLQKRFAVTDVGVIITDMTALPLQRGVIAGPLAYSGFLPLRDLTKTPDIFGRKFAYTMQGVVQGLAAAGGVVMGEGAEQTPFAVISDIPFVTFQEADPTQKELDSLFVSPEQDIFGSFLQSVNWKKGGSREKV